MHSKDGGKKEEEVKGDGNGAWMKEKGGKRGKEVEDRWRRFRFTGGGLVQRSGDGGMDTFHSFKLK